MAAKMPSIVPEHQDIIAAFAAVIGKRHCLTDENATLHYRAGYRSGSGEAMAVLRPGTLVEMWQVMEICHAHGLIVIVQAANTGLTEGSTPSGDYDRDVVIINVMRISAIHLIEDARQVVALPGSTLYDLESLLEPHGREPHSVIGSSCFGASVVGGVCNNSGGALVQRGPAYTEYALYARITDDGVLELVNNLNIDLGETPLEMLHTLDTKTYTDANIHKTCGLASDSEYCDHVKKLDEDTPARFNADPRRLNGASGCAGKIMVFAVRLDTFPREADHITYLLACNAPATLAKVRQRLLAAQAALPVSAEYIHKNAYDLAIRYGKDSVYILSAVSTRFLPKFFRFKTWLDTLFARGPIKITEISDKLLNIIFKLFPNPTPKQLRGVFLSNSHFLLLKTEAGHGMEIEQALRSIAPESGDQLEIMPCDAKTGKRLALIRYAVAGAAIRYKALYEQQVSDIIALDIALPRNTKDWFETLPSDIDDALIDKIYYGHFLCHVFHQDYVVKKSHDPKAIKDAMLEIIAARGAEYPAEHNVGNLYIAKKPLQDFYTALDPTNSFNAGIGKMSKNKNYAVFKG